MVQHMPHSSNTPIDRQSDIPSATRSMEREASVVQAMTEPAESAEPAVAESVAVPETELAVVPSAAEQAEEIARTEVAHRGYRNT